MDSQNRQVELCDLLGEGANPFVHVKLLKKGVSSSVLSHLFGQGSVAGSLLKEDAEFRRKALARVRQAEEEQAQEPSCAAAAAAGGFSGPLADGYSSDGREVVYAIIAPWGGLDLVQKLPFFSKQNLCEHARRLRTAGYTVTHARIEAKAVATSAK